VLGLDPSLGIMHADAKGRRSMALDLMEPVRPLVEQWTLDLLVKRSFKKSDFVETSDGHVRLLAPLTHELAGSMSQWRNEIAPWAEKVAHLLGQAMRGKYQPVTPLTGTNHVGAQRSVRKRKTQEAIYQDVFTRETPPPRQRPRRDAKVTLRNCRTCGGPLARDQHVNCAECWERSAGQDFSTRMRRGEAISKARGVGKKWKAEHPGERGDAEWFRVNILPGLQDVKLSEIMRACGVSKSTASVIRSGKSVPSERHWEVLREFTAD
jgi:hypothetical protein